MRIRNTNTGQEFEVLPNTRIPDFYEIVSGEEKTEKTPVIVEEPAPEPEVEEAPVEKPVEKPEKKKKKTSRRKKGAKNGK